MRKLKPAGQLLMLAVLLPVIGCGGSDRSAKKLSDMQMPDQFGLFAIIDDDELQRLDGEKKWEIETWDDRSELPPETEFIISDRILAQSTDRLPSIIHLYRVAGLRNIVTEDGKTKTADGRHWVTAKREELSVPLDFGPVPGRMDTIRATPATPLQPGLYALVLSSGETQVMARLGVEWPDVDKDAYAQTNCVDRIQRDRASYRLCSEGIPGEGLRIEMTDPRGFNTTSGAVLTVQGTITNTSDKVRKVPAILAIIEDESARQLMQMTFAAPISSLNPGQNVAFRELIENPPQSASRVRLSFATGY